MRSTWTGASPAVVAPRYAPVSPALGGRQTTLDLFSSRDIVDDDVSALVDT